MRLHVLVGRCVVKPPFYCPSGRPLSDEALLWVAKIIRLPCLCGLGIVRRLVVRWCTGSCLGLEDHTHALIRQLYLALLNCRVLSGGETRLFWVCRLPVARPWCTVPDSHARRAPVASGSGGLSPSEVKMRSVGAVDELLLLPHRCFACRYGPAAA